MRLRLTGQQVKRLPRAKDAAARLRPVRACAVSRGLVLRWRRSTLIFVVQGGGRVQSDGREFVECVSATDGEMLLI